MLGLPTACWAISVESWTRRHRDDAIGMPVPLPELDEKLKATDDGTLWFCLGPEIRLVTGGTDSTQISNSLQHENILTDQGEKSI